MRKSLLHSITAGIRAVGKTATVLTVMLASGASAFAEADANGYVPIIREGRVWEYTGLCGVTGESLRAFHYMKFDGTAEFNGVEYHRFVQFKTIVVSADDGNVRDRSFGDLNVYYMREDAGKVYVLYDSHDGRIVSQDMEQADGFKPTGDLREFKVYDFTLSEGERWAYPYYLAQGVPEDLEEMEEKDMQTVQYEAPREIGGETCRVMSFQGLSVMGSEDLLKFIEGVGPTMNGHLAVPNLGNVSGVVNNSANPGVQSSLNRVFDVKGNVIYTQPDAVEPPANDGVVPFIREDRIWEYHKKLYLGRDNDGRIIYGQCLVRYKFEGTEEAYGKKYARCILSDAILWKSADSWMSSEIDRSSIEAVKLNECVALVREEGAKVYILLDSNEINECNVPYDNIETRSVGSGEEAVLFDFSVKKDDVSELYLTSYTDGEMISGAIVYDDVVEEQSGKSVVALRNIIPESAEPLWAYYERLRITISARYVEGIGNVGVGEMIRYGGIDTLHIDGVSNPDGVTRKSNEQENEQWRQEIIKNYLGDASRFNYYYDEAGNILYAGKGVENPIVSGVDELTDIVSDDAEAPVYDLMGCPVTKILPGSVYIRNGRKFIGK